MTAPPGRWGLRRPRWWPESRPRRWPRRWLGRKETAWLAVGLILLDLVSGFLLSLPLDKVQHASPVVVDRQGVWLRAVPTDGGRWRLRADLERTDRQFIGRLVAMEDSRFWWHPGVDPVAILRAAVTDLSAGRIRSGGSTLTMQLARRLDPHPRDLRFKLLESLRALGLQLRLGKSGVLADYLTLAPYGGNLEGVRAASLAYFGHEPIHLTDAEQALLIALPQSPEARRPDRHPDVARLARNRVLQRLLARGLITPRAAREAAQELVPHRSGFPIRAWAVSGEIARSATGDRPTVVSTLDASLQARLEGLAAQAAAGQGTHTAAAVIVLETRTRSVRAAVSASARVGGGAWIDATRALRSPGSSLKPFLYAFAFEQGLAAPETRLVDQKVAYEGYEPENFDRSFHGEVTAREALANSLNVPAVALMARLGPAAFEHRLQGAGITIVRPRDGLADPGLALALGGEGITVRDLAVLYAALGDGGVAKPLSWTEAAATLSPLLSGARLVSASAAKQVLDILREAPSPPGRAPPMLSAGAPRLAFKTGTSYGFRDAVAAGVGDRWTVLVWTGRPDGGARPGLTGRDAALPLLFQVFDLLSGETAQAAAQLPQSAPSALRQVDATLSGPQVLFPPDGAALLAEGYGLEARGFVLTARGEGLRWYADGQAVDPGIAGGPPVWRPAGPGFYRLVVIDSRGRRATSRVRVK